MLNPVFEDKVKQNRHQYTKRNEQCEYIKYSVCNKFFGNI
jgi:hypothetical protein